MAATQNTTFIPTRADIIVVRMILESRNIPTELVLAILDHARYWREVVHEKSNPHQVKAEWPEYSAIYPYQVVDLRDTWVPRGEEHGKIQEIEFVISSRDQGWTSEDTEGTYNTSSWFETSIVRQREGLLGSQGRFGEIIDGQTFSTIEEARHSMQAQGWDLASKRSPRMDPQEETSDEDEYTWYLQGNLVAEDDDKLHWVVWSRDTHPGGVVNEGSGAGESFIDILETNDIVIVWARATFPGWENNVSSMRMVMRLTI
ncbi:hypothetical protein BS50DRAFT_343367 [Corynespora cassiicola Philippines]|uniref:Uncharacterized protein n=1 Tax=Corynespora cassiicola Philippines TaxID=1448308 RepID=A0A2T2NVX3_CORCC|nr:hypothetical protein BS50DRAFT_343367 [Corynespora cassiicola Philippines]